MKPLKIMLSILYVMTIIGTLILIALSLGCSTTKTTVHTLNKLNVVYTDAATIKYLAKNDRALGFYNPATNTIYCKENDFNTCGHELLHATKGTWHK